MRKPPLIPVLLLALAFLGWGGYWYVGARALEGGLARWFDERRAAGWVAETRSLDTAGFPNRFDTSIAGLELADPASGLAWEAPLLQILQLSYRPNQAIVVWPDRQTLAIPGERLTIDTGDMRASLAFVPGTALALDRAVIALEAAEITSQAGWDAGLAAGQLSLRRAPEADPADNLYDLAITGSGLRPPAGLLRRAGQEGLPDALEMINLEASAAFDAPWDRRAIEEARPQFTRIELDDLTLTWGELDLRMAGAVEVRGGVPEGEVTLRAQNWREMLRLVRASGAVPREFLDVIGSALDFVAGLSSDPDVLDIPLRLSGGRVFVGAFPVATAPDLTLR